MKQLNVYAYTHTRYQRMDDTDTHAVGCPLLKKERGRGEEREGKGRKGKGREVKRIYTFQVAPFFLCFSMRRFNPKVQALWCMMHWVELPNEKTNCYLLHSLYSHNLVQARNRTYWAASLVRFQHFLETRCPMWSIFGFECVEKSLEIVDNIRTVSTCI